MIVSCTMGATIPKLLRMKTLKCGWLRVFTFALFWSSPCIVLGRSLAKGWIMAKVLVVGASGGIGAALVGALTAAGHQVTPLSRSTDGLDITDEASVAECMATLQGPFDTVFIATGALEIGSHLPEKSLRAVTAAGLLAQFQTNAIGPMLVLKHLVPHLPRDRLARVGILSARVGSIGDNGLGGWYSYRSAKAALNQLVHTAAIELSRSHKQAVLALLHPGTVETSFTAKYAGHHPTVPPEAAAQNLLAVLGALGPAQSGGFYDWAGKPVPW
jgi:NAD(P)-dependent dehydrogenase (short-subunit alcohol dehydrogenase family)